ncbi:recombinase family protein [Pseudogulbenkiania subflava]|uniref:Site-specific DNA recombinase n=1 Tax=Pseudogulbenkiania subflava DSM 22618 TaxID=1123014 RepID=A0A1Y6CES8_9NEIS|nr:recombinase family protein [Pseudogulbenkiania subflava]SMF52375.1 Site-specific DNA recombinase [Pseudogulbenkiania subflava DSM 22618]
MKNTRVYSYRRFSSGRQASGHSLERQSEAARRWCAERGFTLDNELVLADLGVSAYTGDNATRGALSAFLTAAEAGRVPKGSILLLESLDRLTRTAIPEAVGLLTSIVRAGIRVVSMIDGQEWNNENINDTTNFLVSVLLFARAHEESATKAKRVSAAFQKKRTAGLAVVSTKHGPGWANPSQDMSHWMLDEEKAEAVKRTFELAANGLGGIAIARIANQEGWDYPWRVKKSTTGIWEHTTISRLLRDRRVLGEWQPHRMVAGRLTPDGDVVQDYFPRVISDELWHKVQASLVGRPGPKRMHGITADIFAGLLFCRCGKKMERKAPSGRGVGRYYCLGRKAGLTECPSLPEPILLGPVLSGLAQMEQDAFKQDSAATAAREALALAEAKAADAQEKADRLLAAIEDGGHNDFILQRLATIQKEKNEAVEAALAAKEKLASLPIQGRTFGEDLARQAHDAVADKEAGEIRHKLAMAIASVVQRIDWHGRIVMIKTHSGNGIAINPPAELLEKRLKRKATGVRP